MDKVTAGRDAMSKFAPKFAELNDDVLFQIRAEGSAENARIGSDNAKKGSH